MRVKIHYYGRLTEASGCEEEEIILNPSSTLTMLESVLTDRYPDFNRIPLIFFSNSSKCEGNLPLNDGMNIECMPPFSGG